MNQRVRIRFAKRGDLKLIGHRDLVRALERLFRRMGANLAMSQGFHPRPLMTFPDALAIGVAAENEVMDLTLQGEVNPHELRSQMNAQAPAGLEVLDVQLLGDNDRKAKLERMVYELKLPESTDLVPLEQAIVRLKGEQKLVVDRREKQVELDLTETLEGLWVDGTRLMMCIHVAQQSQLLPRDILAALGLRHLLREGAPLTRTSIELAK